MQVYLKINENHKLYPATNQSTTFPCSGKTSRLVHHEHDELPGTQPRNPTNSRINKQEFTEQLILTKLRNLTQLPPTSESRSLTQASLNPRIC